MGFTMNELKGCLIPIKDGCIVLLKMGGSEDYFVPIFSDEVKFLSVRNELGWVGTDLAKIDDVKFFVDDIKARCKEFIKTRDCRLRVAMNPKVQGIGVDFIEFFLDSN